LSTVNSEITEWVFNTFENGSRKEIW